MQELNLLTYEYLIQSIYPHQFWYPVMVTIHLQLPYQDSTSPFGLPGSIFHGALNPTELRAHIHHIKIHTMHFNMVGPQGFEPWTYRLKAGYSNHLS